MGRNVDAIDISNVITLPGWLATMEPKKLYALRLHPNCETKVMRAFKLHRIDGYVPTMPKVQTVTQRSRWNDAERKIERRVIVPVFPALVFVPEYVARYGGTLRGFIDGVIDVLQFGPWVAYLDDAGCADMLDTVLRANTPRSKRAVQYRVGDTVSITQGPFRGFRGEFNGLDSKGRLSVVMSMFGRLQPVQVTDEQIEPV